MTWAYTMSGSGQPKLVSGQFTALISTATICFVSISLRLARSSFAYSTTGSALPEIESLLNEPEKRAYPTSNKLIIPITRNRLRSDLALSEILSIAYHLLCYCNAKARKRLHYSLRLISALPDRARVLSFLLFPFTGMR